MVDLAKKRQEKKKKQKERKKLEKQEKLSRAENGDGEVKKENNSSNDENNDVEIEYVARADLDENDPNYQEWAKIFSLFAPKKDEQQDDDDVKMEDRDEKENNNNNKSSSDKKPDADDDDDEEDTVGTSKISKKKQKLLSRLSIAELKQVVARPDVVEVWDITSRDPKLLVFLKAYRNSVPVPRHWCHKRKYLQGKRGIDKGPFKLPDFIEQTGIARVRQAYMEKEEGKSLRQTQKERMTPKMHKMDIDYQKLHDAFFRYQTKPKLTSHADLYYEGKEFEIHLKEMRPGNLSDALKKALGLPESGPPHPPPFLINMQRFGPPPSYPHLKIPGLNAPLPEGGAFGYHPGGWGKPPVDEFGRPLYGDVFGVQQAEEEREIETREQISKSLWGELGEEEEEEEEEGEGDEMEGSDAGSEGEGEGGEGEEGDETTSEMDRAEVESGISSVTSGLETPGTFDPRKGSGLETPDSVVDVRKGRQLYEVLEQQQTSVGSGIMGSSYRYVIPTANDNASASAAGKKRVDLMKSQKSDAVEVNIDPAELEGLDEKMLKEKYEKRMQENKPTHEDVSDVFEEESKKRARKKATGKDAGKKTKYF